MVNDSIPQILNDELRRRVGTNASYSLRSFARDLGLSPGALSEILRGKRPLSVRAVPAIVRALGLNAAEGRHLLRLARREVELEMPAAAKALRLEADRFQLVADWYHFAILNLLDCQPFTSTTAWVAERLGLSRLQADLAIKLLKRLGLVAERAGRWVAREREVFADSEVPSAAIRTFHRQILEKAAHALEAQALEERDISGVGFALDPAHLPAIKREIARFQEDLVARFSKGKRSEVYFMEIALFKLTQGSRK